MRLRSWRAAAAFLLGAGSYVALAAPPASAATSCKVTYSVVNQWDTGFQASIDITNTGDPVTKWTLGFSFSGGQQVTQGWNGTWSQSGADVTVTDAGFNASLATGATTNIGFLANWSGSNPDPADFTLNGVACNGASQPPPPTTGGTAPPLHVSGNKLADDRGNTVRLHGVNRSGGEYSCIQDNGFFDGPVDDTSLNAMATWNVKAVRVPLNEECWLGTSNVDPQFAGANYQNEVKAFVGRIEAHGMTPIVEMHWSQGQYTGPGSGCADVHATCQKPMPDAELAPQFWTGVANAFRGDNAVVFDLFNEPFPDFADNFDATPAWTCWRDGGTCPGISYQVAGMQSLVNAVRGTGATNVIMLGGLAFSNDMSQWLAFRPTDPAGNLAASTHVYNFNACSNTACWDSQNAPVAAQVPLVAGEIGENDCAHGFIDTLMGWLDDHGASYLGWAWNADFQCNSGPGLITSYDGTPTNYGVGLRDHLTSMS